MNEKTLFLDGGRDMILYFFASFRLRTFPMLFGAFWQFSKEQTESVHGDGSAAGRAITALSTA